MIKKKIITSSLNFYGKRNHKFISCRLGPDVNPALIFWTCFILTFDGENGRMTTKSMQSSQTENFDDSDYFLEDFRPARIIFPLMSLCSGKWWFWFFDDFPNISPAFCWKKWTSICSKYDHFVRVTKNIATHRKNVVTRGSQVVIRRAKNVVRCFRRAHIIGWGRKNQCHILCQSSNLILSIRIATTYTMTMSRKL